MDQVKIKRFDKNHHPTDRFWLTCTHPTVKLPNGTPKPQVNILQYIRSPGYYFWHP